MSIERKTHTGNISVSISENEVRLWVCNDEGQNIYRFKAMGKVYKQSDGVVVIGETKLED